MKISKKAQEDKRRKLVAAAVKIMKKKGFRATSMREIAKAAGQSEATVYKYFAGKEDILYTFFYLKLIDARDQTEAIPDFKEYTFRERLQAFLENSLAGFEPDRAFVDQAYDHVFHGDWVGAYQGSRRSQDEYFAMVESWIADGVAAGEFPDPPLHRLLDGFLWDMMVGVTWYWLKDKSNKHVATTELIDRALDLLAAGMKVDVLGRAADLARFLVREHVLGPLARSPEWFKEMGGQRRR